MITPPRDTRAFFRGSCLARYATSLVAASWDALIFDLDGQTLKRVPMLDPFKGTAVPRRGTPGRARRAVRPGLGPPGRRLLQRQSLWADILWQVRSVLWRRSGTASVSRRRRRPAPPSEEGGADAGA